MDQIDDLIEGKKAKILKLEQGIKKIEQQIAEARAELRGMESVRDALKQGGLSEQKKPPQTGGRGLSDNWKRILRFIGRDGRSIDEIMEYVSTERIDVQRNAVRSQAHTLSSKGLLERIREGHFKLTEKGLLEVQENESPSVGADGLSGTTLLVSSEHTRNDAPGDMEL